MIFEFTHNDMPIKFGFTNSDDFLSQQIIQHECFYELRYLKFIEKYKRKLIRRPNGVIIDVGAHIGNHTIFFSKILKCRVFSFEPQKDIYDILRKNVQYNNVGHLVTTRHMAISAIEREVAIVKEFKDMCGSTQWWYNKSDRHAHTVQSFPLDSLFKKRVDLIKIDVEGMEIEVLKGAENIIRKYCPAIMIETTDMDGEGHFPNKQKFENWLRRFDYIKVGTKHFNRHTHLIVKRGLLKFPENEEELKDD